MTINRNLQSPSIPSESATAENNEMPQPKLTEERGTELK